MRREPPWVRERGTEEGFTLIELMVVVLIIAILIAIAIPTFLGARRRAEDRAAQSNLRTALVTAKVIYTDKETYLPADAATLATAETSLLFVDAPGASTGPRITSVLRVSTTRIVLAAVSKSGACFYLSDDTSSGGTLYYQDRPATCVASASPGPWQSSW